MYECSVCGGEVIVDHVNPPIKPCGHTGTIYASMKGALAGIGGLNATASNNNLSQESQLIVKAVLHTLTLQEFFKENKKDIFVNDQIVIDESTGRKFKFTLKGEEV